MTETSSKSEYYRAVNCFLWPRIPFTYNVVTIKGLSPLCMAKLCIQLPTMTP